MAQATAPVLDSAFASEANALNNDSSQSIPETHGRAASGEPDADDP